MEREGEGIGLFSVNQGGERRLFIPSLVRADVLLQISNGICDENNS